MRVYGQSEIEDVVCPCISFHCSTAVLFLSKFAIHIHGTIHLTGWSILERGRGSLLTIVSSVDMYSTTRQVLLVLPVGHRAWRAFSSFFCFMIPMVIRCRSCGNGHDIQITIHIRGKLETSLMQAQSLISH